MTACWLVNCRRAECGGASVIGGGVWPLAERRLETPDLVDALAVRKRQHNSEHQRSEAGRILAAAFDACTAV